MKSLVTISFLAVQLAGGGMLCLTLCVGQVLGAPQSHCHKQHQHTSDTARGSATPQEGTLPSGRCCCPALLGSRNFVEKNALESLGLTAADALVPASAVVVSWFDGREVAPRGTGHDPGVRSPLYLLDRHLLI
jgi:hypothetical protein